MKTRNHAKHASDIFIFSSWHLDCENILSFYEDISFFYILENFFENLYLSGYNENVGKVRKREQIPPVASKEKCLLLINLPIFLCFSNCLKRVI